MGSVIEKTAWWRLYVRDREAAFQELEETLIRYDGNVARTAHALGYKQRKSFYRAIWRDGDRLWPMIDRVRADALKRLEERRRLLTGDPKPWL